MNRISVVIPAYNAADTLAECLSSLARSFHKPDEVIVVDDGSHLAQAAPLAELVSKHGGRLVRQKNAGPAAARNRGARESTGDILVFLDADVCVHPETIGQMAAAMADPQLAAVFGSYDDDPRGGGVVSDFRNLLHHFVHQGSMRQASTFWAGCGAIRKSIFASTGFDESYTGASIEDVALGRKLRSAGHRIELRPEIQVTHLKRWTLRSFLSTDLFSRAIPWTRMMLAQGDGLPGDLNFGFVHRASTLLAACLLLALLLAIRLPRHGVMAAAMCLLLLAVVNRRFLAFLAKRRGTPFALLAFPLHIAHYVAGGLGFVAGHLAEWSHRDRQGLHAVAILAGVSLGLQLASGAYQADFVGHADEASHFVGGQLVAQYLERPSPVSPMAFAESYYLHFPRFAIGHWPPGFYLLEGVWFLFVGGTRLTGLLLQAMIGCLLATIVYACIRTRAPAMPALGGASLLLLSRPLQRALGMTMVDSLTALFALAAAVAFAFYLARPNIARSLLFGLLAAGGMLTKGSALPVLLVPGLAILITRQWRLLARFDLWLTALPVLLLAGPWYVFALRFDSPNNGPLMLPRQWNGGWSMWFEYPAAMLLLALAGAIVLMKRDPLVAALIALVAGYVMMPLLVPHFNDDRQLIPGAAGAAVLAGWAVGQLSPVPARILLGAALASLLHYHGAWVRYPVATFRPWISNLYGLAERVMIAGPRDGEIVAAMAEHLPRSGPLVLRSSRVLATSDWNGRRYASQVSDVPQTQERLTELGVGLVLMEADPQQPHDQLLAQAVRQWVNRPAPHGMRLFINPVTPVLKPFEIEQKRLRRAIRPGVD